MKHCSYCGAEYPDYMSECPMDHEPLLSSDTPRSQVVGDKPRSQIASDDDEQEERETIREGIGRRKRIGALLLALCFLPVVAVGLIGSIESLESGKPAIGYTTGHHLLTSPIIGILLSSVLLLVGVAFFWQMFRTKPTDKKPDDNGPSA